MQDSVQPQDLMESDTLESDKRRAHRESVGYSETACILLAILWGLHGVGFGLQFDAAGRTGGAGWVGNHSSSIYWGFKYCEENEITQITNHSSAIYKNNLLVCPVLFVPSHNFINVSPVSLPVGMTRVTGRVMDRGRKCLLWMLWLVRKRKRMPAMSTAAHTFFLNNMAGRMTTGQRARWPLNQPFSQPMATCLDGVIWTPLSAPPALWPALSPWSLSVSQSCLLACVASRLGEMGL